MSELTLTVLRLGLLAVLWLFVLAVVGVLRADLFGTRVTTRRTEAARPRVRRPAAAAAEPARPKRATLVVTEGALRGTTLTLSQAPVLIGRAPDCTLVLDDEYASTRHVRITANPDGTGEGWLVEDLQSTNGTFLGRDRLTTPTPFEPGTPLRIGKTVLELRR